MRYIAYNVGNSTGVLKSTSFLTGRSLLIVISTIVISLMLLASASAYSQYSQNAAHQACQ